MPLDPQAKRFLAMMAAASPGDRSRTTANDRRQALAKLMQLARADATAVVAVDGVLPGPVGDIPYRLYGPSEDLEQLPGFVFFHGGGMVAGGIDTHDRVCTTLAQVTGCRLLRGLLAPEHKFPRRRMRCRTGGYPACLIARHQCDW